MCLNELKEQASRLSFQERFELSSFLAELDEQNEAEFRHAVDRRMKGMDAGKRVTQEEPGCTISAIQEDAEPKALNFSVHPQVVGDPLDCGGKRSATPLSAASDSTQSAVATALCRRSPYPTDHSSLTDNFGMHGQFSAPNFSV